MISFVLHAISLVVIVVLVGSVSSLQKDTNMLNKATDYLGRQSLMFNGRTNNLEGCWKNNDYECPENKYFDASRFMRD